MFGSVNMTPDYTFTQTTNGAFTSNISKALSSYLGNVVVSKTEQDRVAQNNLKSESTKTDKNKDAEEVKTDLEDYTVEVDDIINGNSDGESYGISYGSTSAITTSFDSLAAAVGASSSKVSKTQLIALLQSLVTNTSGDEDSTKEIAFVKNLIAKFDTLSEGSDYITSFSGVDEPQDYETVTSEQVTSPIDLRV